LWQLKQLVAPTGICVAGLPLAETPWQLAQFVVAVYVLWSTFAPPQLAELLWQLSQLPLTVTWVALIGLPTA
jgi:hypothetical protein